MSEEWRPAVGYEDYFLVSNTGRVIRKQRIVNSSCNNMRKCGGYEVIPSIGKRGYYCLSLRDTQAGLSKLIMVHSLVAKTFIPNPLHLPCVNHKDENKLNNVVILKEDGSVDYENSNLEWCTNEYNITYGTAKERGRNTQLLNQKTGIPILQLSLNGEVIKEYKSAREAARTLGFRSSAITNVLKGRKKSTHGYKFRYKTE